MSTPAPVYEYMADQELPAIPVEWRDKDGALIDFSSGWTFTAKVCAANTPTTIALTKTTGITGAATSPNVLIDWTTSDFASLTPGPQVVHLYARRTSDSKDRVFRPAKPITFLLLTAPATP